MIPLDPSLRSLLNSGAVRCPRCDRQLDELDQCGRDLTEEGERIDFACRHCYPDFLATSLEPKEKN